jgi:hypothetical protein
VVLDLRMRHHCDMPRARAGGATARAVVALRGVHSGLAIVILAALGIQLVLIFTGGADANSGEAGRETPIPVRLWRLFSYFTVDSNLIVLGTAIVLAARPLIDGVVWRVVRLDALLCILITGLVFAIILAPQVHLSGASLVATILFHYVSPAVALLAWLLFGPRPRMTAATVVAAFIWPVVWLGYTFTQGAFTRWYPYPFLDAGELGLGPAVRNCALVVAVAVVLALVLKLLDSRLPALISTPPLERPAKEQPSTA